MTETDNVTNFQNLVKQSRRLEAEHAATSARLEDSKAAAQQLNIQLEQKYGTSNIDELQTKLAELRTEQDERLLTIQTALDTISEGLK
jgi:hypothetical protein